MIADILSGGRTSVIYQDLVRDKRLSLQAGAGASMPGGKYPNLFYFYLVPAQGHTAAENEKELDAVKFDEIKLASTNLENDFSYYRRTINRMKGSGDDPDAKMTDADADRVAAFFKQPMPMLRTFVDAFVKEINERRQDVRPACGQCKGNENVPQQMHK